VVDNVVVEQQTGWAGEDRFTDKNWAVHFCYKPIWYKVADLPDTVTATISHHPTSGTYSCGDWDCYWRTVVTSGGDGNLPNSDTDPTTEYPATYYLGWCVDLGVTIGSGSHTFNVYAYYDSSMPSGEWSNPWGKINWIINNKGDYDANEIQHVISNLCGDWADSKLTPDEIALRNAANSHADFIPWVGDWMAVVLQSYDKDGKAEQTIIIEVDP
jgi:hypothetical protein